MASTAGAALSTYTVGPPTAAVVPPGECFFSEEFSSAPLVQKQVVSHDTKVFTFGLPEGKSLGLSTCACILARGGKDDEGNPVIRPYTPVSTNATSGSFDLMVKVYPGGKLSGHLDSMNPGDVLEFKHIPFNVKIQYPFPKKSIGMLVGGTGITPMVQALHALLGTEGDASRVAMLFGNRTSKDILCKDFLDAWTASHPDRLKVTHVLSHEPEDSDWSGPKGFINKELIEANMSPPSDDTMIFVCGPPPMYNALCGPRDQKELTGALAEMGYTAEMVYKF